MGAEKIAALAGYENAIAFDMGGTSTDVCLIAGGKPGRSEGREVAGFPVQLPMLDIHTVGAGGGSIVWRDAGGAIRVGPASAGACPGPACYGRGGTAPTVTDANLLLGRLPSSLPGGLELDRDAAELRTRRHRPGGRGRPRQRRDAPGLAGGLGRARVTTRASARSSLSAEQGPCMRASSPTSSAPRSSSCPKRPGCSPRSASSRVTSGEITSSPIVRPLGEAGELPPDGEASLRYRGQSFELDRRPR